MELELHAFRFVSVEEVGDTLRAVGEEELADEYDKILAGEDE